MVQKFDKKIKEHEKIEINLTKKAQEAIDDFKKNLKSGNGVNSY